MSPQKHTPPQQEETSDSLYLNQLTYTDEARKTFLNFFVERFRIIVLIIIGMILAGLFSFPLLPLESQPEVQIPYGIVTVSLPGASPADIEELVVEKIESRVANLTGVKQVVSNSLNSVGSITVEFRAEEDLKDAIRRLRDTVESVKGELPEEASDPIVSEISFSDQPVWTLVLTGPYDSFTLRKYAEVVQDELLKLPETNTVNISGGDIAEIQISYDPQRMAAYNLSIDQVNGIIRANNFSLPLGEIDISNFRYTVKADGKLRTAEDLRNLPILTVNNEIVRLEDVATVVERAQDRSVITTFSVAGQPPQNAITLNVVKKTGGSIINLIDRGKERIAALKTTDFPQDLNIETILDYSEIIRKDVNHLVRDGLLTILLVTVVLFLFVGLKEAIVAGVMAVPLTFACSFALMHLTGISLNFLSLFSLILSLGILVDDAIVVVQATKQYLKTGKFTPEEAVLLVFKDYKVLLIVTSLTTIWAFLPLLLATGIIGQFIRSIPITVTVTMLASTVVAILVSHPMAIVLERYRLNRTPFKIVWALGVIVWVVSLLSTTSQVLAGESIFSFVGPIILLIVLLFSYWYYHRFLRAKLIRNEELVLEERANPEKIKAKIYHHYNDATSWWAKLTGGVVKLDKILPGYGRILNSLLSSRLKTGIFFLIAAILFIGALSLPATGILRSEFLSPADSQYLYINIEGAPGLLAHNIREVADQVQDVLINEKTIKNFSLVTGSGGVNISGDFGGGAGGAQTNRAQFAVNFYPFEERPPTGPNNTVEKSYDIARRLRQQVSSIQGATIEVVELAGGPPTGADIDAQISGEDLREVERWANVYKDILSEIPGTINEKTSITLSPGEFTFSFDSDQMALRGVNSTQIAAQLRTALSGSEVTKILRDGDDIVVEAEFDAQAVKDLDTLRNLQLVNPRGQLFRLGDVAEVSVGSSLTSIQRIDQKRVISVTAAVEKPYLPPEVLAEFLERIKDHPLPNGYEISFGGQNESNTESIFSIFRAMLVAMLLIIATLVIQYNSFRKATLVLATIPLAITGVFYGLTAIGFTLSFPVLIGIVALFGIVVKNAVIMVDKINLNINVGIPFKEAIIDAAKSRLEAIFLTSICTIIGMIPITFTSETWEGLGASLIFGLGTSTILTLFIIPMLYNWVMRRSYEKEMRVKELKIANAMVSE